MSVFNRNDETLDQAIAEVTGEPIDPAVVEQAASRVWERLSQGAPVHKMESQPAAPIANTAEVHGSLSGCDDFQALIPAFVRGELSPARALLVEDHTRGCVPCRRALREAREGKAKEVRPAASASLLSGRRSRLVWQSIAAALVLGVGIGLFLLIGEMMAGGSKMARVESVEGLLFEVDGQMIRQVNNGDTIDEGQEIRTAKGSTALVRMTDGSGIELSERATMSLEASRKGNTIHLDGGRVIVEAAKQRNRHLFVSTNDSLVSVTGTIFSVNNGTKGTRVSVVEGEVRVKQARRDDILHPGDQVTTHASVSAVPIRREVAWSRNAQQYEKLLAELTALGKEIDAQVERPGLRYSTKLLDLAPEGTMAFIALPNLAHSLSETHRILDEKVETNPTVRQWWSETLGTSEKQQKFREMIQKIGDVGRYLGEELAIAIPADAGGKDEDVPVIMAEVTDEAGFRATLEQEIAELKGKHGDAEGITIVENPAGLSGILRDGMYLWVGNGLFVASPNGSEIARIAAGGSSAFTGTPFRARIAQEYQDGAGWLFAANIAGFIASDSDGPDAEAEALGVRDLQHFIVNRQEVDGRADTRAALTFSQQRRGIASWLAAPAPMGALSFISPDANLASAFIVKQPASVLDDLLAASPEMAAELEKVRQEHGFDVRNDLAATLGGEVVFAVDGPLLPTPSWKLVVEVYDPARLQQTLEKMVQHVNDELRKEGNPGMTMQQEEVGGRTFYSIQSKQPKVGFDYTFEDGYLVASPTRALLERSLQQRESGVSLASHPKFRDLLGQDGQVNVSAFFYQNLQPVLESAGKLVPQEMKKNQNQLQNLILGQGPTLIYAYAEEDRILFASTNTSPLGLNLQTLAGMGGVLGMMDEAHGEAERMQAETSADETR
ncbi:MAG TPA: FecR domain-containing protein [Thermoanaerobaculia bacterium]|nr:FecR domain-containing protein [Thermoanaerobaculia bacterium]